MLGVVADSAPGEGESISAAMAEGDSEDIMLGDGMSQLLSVMQRIESKKRLCVSWTGWNECKGACKARVVGRRGS